MKTVHRSACILVLILIILTSCSSGTGVSIKDNGTIIEITTKDHSIKAVKGNPVADTYVLFTANPIFNPDSLKYLDGRLIVLTKAEVDSLKTQYGNFMDVENKGYAVARKSIKRLNVIAADKNTRDQIKKLVTLNSKKFYPLVKLTMTEITVSELMHKKTRVILNGKAATNYLVSKIEILQDNYSM